MHLCIRTQLMVFPLLASLACCGLTSVTRADTIMLAASKDNTLFNDDKGIVSNGTGNLFVGRTGGQGPGPLRALLAFHIASEIPLGSTITDVSLTLTVLQAGTGSGDETYSLHSVEQDWGEGDSLATTGRGAPSATGDATWIHTFFDSTRWNTPGGDFNATPSASQVVSDSGPVTWGSSSGLVADVQTWLDNPNTNFGWILIGDETRFASARRFGSREAIANAPLLTVTFTPVPEPSSLVLGILASLGWIPLARRRPF